VVLKRVYLEPFWVNEKLLNQSKEYFMDFLYIRSETKIREKIDLSGSRFATHSVSEGK